MIWPKPLQKGSVVGVVAPASPPNPDALEEGLRQLEEWGLKPVVGSSCKKVRGYLAGEDRERAADLNRMFASEEIDAIWCSNGGYGTPRILEYLDYELVRKKPKLFIGYSDITAIHLAFNQLCSLITIHGPMVATELGRRPDNYTESNLKEIIFGKWKGRALKNPSGRELSYLVEGKGKGKLTGGNLSLIAATIGSKYEIDTNGKVLFLEEIDEKPYRIDRMLAQLKNAGKLKNLAGVIFGDFTSCDPDRLPSLSISEIITDYFGAADYPVITGLRCGHGKQTMTIPLGAEIAIDTANNLLKII